MTSAPFPRTVSRIALALTFLVALLSAPMFAQGVSPESKTTSGESSSAAPKLIEPEELARILQSPKGGSPLILNVGYRVLYQQARSAFGVHWPCV